MFEGLGFSFLEPSHTFLPTAAMWAVTHGMESHRRSIKQRRARSDSEALYAKMPRAATRRSDGNDGNDNEADDLML